MSVIGLVLLLACAAEPGPAPPEVTPAESEALTRARLCWTALDAECAESALAEARGRLAELPAREQMQVLTLSAEVAPKQAIAVRLRVRDPSGVARVSVRAGGRDFVCVTADGELWQVELPRDIVKVPDLSLDTTALDRAGNVSTRHDVIAVVVVARPPDDTPLTSRWWFWTAIGVGVAAIVTTVVVVTAGDGAVARAGDGSIVVDVQVAPEPAP